MALLVEDKFLILKSIKSFILNLENIIINFPKKDLFVKDAIYNDALELLELICKANYESNLEIKKKYQIDALAKINKIDFYLERAYKLRYISEKQAIRLSGDLLKINKMLYAWCRNGK